jgi:hypothetical protein
MLSHYGQQRILCRSEGAIQVERHFSPNMWRQEAMLTRTWVLSKGCSHIAHLDLWYMLYRVSLSRSTDGVMVSGEKMY